MLINLDKRIKGQMELIDNLNLNYTLLKKQINKDKKELLEEIKRLRSERGL